MRKSARAAWLLTLNILKVSFRKKATLITFFVLPILGILLSIGAYSRIDSGSAAIGVMDRDQSLLSQDLVKSLRNGAQFKVTRVDEKEINSKIIAGTVDSVVVIPNGFGAGIYRNQLKKLTIISLKGEAASAWIKSFLNPLVRNLADIRAAAGGQKKAYDRMYASYQQERIAVNVIKVEDRTRSKGMTARSIGFLILFMLVGVGNSIEMILKEKRNRTYYRILATPVSSRVYILGNVFANLIIVAVQVLLALLVMTMVFGIKTYIPFWQLYLILIIFGLSAIGLGLLIVAFAKDTSQAGVLQNLIITPTCLMAGCFWPVEIMPKAIQRIADFLPQKWAIAAVQKLQEGAGFNQVIIHVTIILAFALALFLIAAYRFSRNDDVKSFV